MAKFCRICNEFKGGVKTCCVCKLPACSDCRITNLCKDCFVSENKEEILGGYYNDKKESIDAIVL